MNLVRNRTCGAGLTVFLLLVCLISPAQSKTEFDVTLLQHQPLQQRDYAYRTTLMLGNRSEHLLLNPSPVFADLVVTDDAGAVIQSDSATAQAYTGVVEDIPGSWARVTIHNDSISGLIDVGKERYHVNSNKGQLPHPWQIRNALHAVTAVDTEVFPPQRQLNEADRMIREVVEVNINSGLTPKPGVITRVARIAIVIDNLYDEAHGGRGLNHAISTINSVDGLYREKFGLALKVDHAIVVTDNSTLGLGNVSLEQNLATFRDYRMGAIELEPELGMVHLFSGAITDDSSVGLAYIGAACRTDGYDVSISLPFRYPVLLTAHEIGHNLGALHDDETELCKDSTDRLMYSHINATTTESFSSCSTEKISRGLELSSCHLQAIDAALTLTRDETDTITAVVTNTDQYRTFPGLLLKLELKNTSIAAAPAICNIEASTVLECAVPPTEAEKSFSLAFELQPEGTDEKTISATLDASDFIDPQTINNSAEIVIAATESVPNGTLVIANNDDTGTADTPTGNANSAGASASSSGGGVFSGMLELLLLALALIAVSRCSNFRQVF